MKYIANFLFKWYSTLITKKRSSLVFDFLNNKKIHLCDIGAAGGLEPRWLPYKDLLYTTSFEPDNRSPTTNGDTFRTINSALWSEPKTIEFNLTSKPQCSSVYTPNNIYLSQFPDYSRFNIIKKISVSADKLDSYFLDNNPFDFIKLDIQGAELEVLKGSSNALQHCFAIECEIEFKSMYENQPLFSEVQSFCELNDLMFIDFTNLCRWERNAFRGIGECSFGDALFIKYPEIIANLYRNSLLPHDRLKKYISILYIYNRVDLLITLKKCLNGQNFDSFDLLIIDLSRRTNKAILLRNYFQKFYSFICPDAKLHLKL